jgi:uracil-DNA glycosylase
MKNNVERLNALFNYWRQCSQCSLANERKNVVFGYGSPDAKVMIIGEAPGESEDESGYPFVGPAGRLLDQYLGMVSTNPDIKEAADATRDNFDPALLRRMLTGEYFFTNVVGCRPPENRDPSLKEVACCFPRVQQIIYLVDPIIILAVGKVALQALTGKKNLSITQVRGEVYDIEIPGMIFPVQYSVVAMLHTSYLLRMNDFKSDTGIGAKTYQDVLKAHRILDQVMFRHYGIEIPKRDK